MHSGGQEMGVNSSEERIAADFVTISGNGVDEQQHVHHFNSVQKCVHVVVRDGDEVVPEFEFGNGDEH